MRVLAVLVALACAAGVARADDKPWAKDVPAENQKTALEIYKQANSAFEQAQYKDALAEYEKALALWDHPAIRYNAAVCLINLDRPVEAYEHLLAALRFGDAPLGRELYAQGLTYRRLLEGRVATLEVTCNEPDAKVSLDGKHLFDAPNSATKLVSAEHEHQIVAEKPGYETRTEALKLAPGKHTLVLALKPLAAARRLERRWPKWQPWAVLAGGAAIAAFGGVMAWQSSTHYDEFDAGVKAACPTGCSETAVPAPTRELRSRADLERILAYSGASIGGAAVAVGLTMVLLNQPRLVAPMAGSHRVGLVVSARW